MRRKWVVPILILPALMTMMAGGAVPVNPMGRSLWLGKDSLPNPTDSIADSVVIDIDTLAFDHEPDTLQMDSLARAIYRHNKIIDDSLLARV